MNYSSQIIETIKASAVTRILIVDDSYDAPAPSEETIGSLVALLQGNEFRAHVDNEVLPDEEAQSAIEAIGDGDLDADSVLSAMSALYEKFIETRTPDVDPEELFKSAKGVSLEVLDPLVEMLKRCGDDIKLRLVGLEGAVAASRDMTPDLIFMDFFLSPTSRSDGPSTRGEEDSDRERSIKILKEMLAEHADNKPAVVLMSSKDVKNRAQRYRTSLAGQVMSLRFGYLHKQWVTGSGKTLRADGEAADVLIDTSGSLAFGRSLEAAITDWRDGAALALEKLEEELQEFDIKDFAYLMRFRLYEEAEPFADYLEWFLGESLRALVDQHVTWDAPHFEELNDEELTRSIEGAHPFPSDKIARFFHRMRFNGYKSRERGRFGLGDVFISPNKKRVRMVISPDCDLVVRNGKARAVRLLTVGGQVKGLKEDEAFAGELVHLSAPKGIKWLNKDLMTHAAGKTGELAVEDVTYEFLGRLRGLPAQAIQKAALADLSRVGVSVPPTVHVGAPVTCFVRKLKDGNPHPAEIGNLPGAAVQVLMPRGDKDSKKRLLFTQQYARAVIAHLENCDEAEFSPDHKKLRKDAIKNNGEELRKAMVSTGIELPGELKKFGVLTSIKRASIKRERKAWIEFVCDLSDDSLLKIEANQI